MNALQVLQAARERISRPEHWCKHHMATCLKGEYRGVLSDHACRWCLSGALLYASECEFMGSKMQARMDARRIIERLLMSEGIGGIIQFNDDRKTRHSDVLAVLDKAIEIARRKA